MGLMKEFVDSFIFGRPDGFAASFVQRSQLTSVHVKSRKHHESSHKYNHYGSINLRDIHTWGFFFPEERVTVAAFS